MSCCVDNDHLGMQSGLKMALVSMSAEPTGPDTHFKVANSTQGQVRRRFLILDTCKKRPTFGLVYIKPKLEDSKQNFYPRKESGPPLAPMGPSWPVEETMTLDSSTLGSMHIWVSWFSDTRVQLVTAPPT